MLRADEFYVQRFINDGGGLPEIGHSIEGIKHWLNQCHYKQKDIRLDEWNPDDGEIYETVLGIFTSILRFGDNGTTYQSLMGLVSGRFPHKELLDRVKTAGEVIALLVKHDLLSMWRTASNAYYMLSSKYDLDTGIPEPDDYRIHTERIPQFTTNKPSGYRALILGGKHNYHDKGLCLDHINRMNNIELQLNIELLDAYEEQPTFVLDNKKKREQWVCFKEISCRAYRNTVKNGNRFFIEHSYCKRGRTYARGYHISTQGSAFKKACVQLAHTEPIKIERSKNVNI
jgi:hypothetical protein